MATNIEDIFRDFVLNKIREIEDEGQQTGATSQESSKIELCPRTETSGIGEESVSVMESHEDSQEQIGAVEHARQIQPVVEEGVAGSAERLTTKEGNETPRKKNKKHKRHKNKKKKKRKEGKESSSESGVESGNETRIRDSVKNQGPSGAEGETDGKEQALSQSLAQAEADLRSKKKRHIAKKKKKKRKKDEGKQEKKSPSRSESTSASGTESETEAKATSLLPHLKPLLPQQVSEQVQESVPVEDVSEKGYEEKPFVSTGKENAPTFQTVEEVMVSELISDQKDFAKAQDLPDINPKLESTQTEGIAENLIVMAVTDVVCDINSEERHKSQSKSRSPLRQTGNTNQHGLSRKSRSRSPSQKTSDKLFLRVHSSSRKRSRSISRRKSLRKKRSRSRSGKFRSRTPSVRRSGCRSRSLSKKRQHSDSRSHTKKRQSRSGSRQLSTRRSRSRSIVHRRRSRSVSKQQRSPSLSRTSRSRRRNRRSRSAKRGRHSRSLSHHRSSRSRSVRRTRRTRSRSVVILRRSRSKSYLRRRLQVSRSRSLRRNRSRSRSLRRQRSTSRSLRRSRRSRTKSLPRWRRTKTPSPYSRSKYRSPERHHRSRSKSQKQSLSPKRNKDSMSKSPTRKKSKSVSRTVQSSVPGPPLVVTEVRKSDSPAKDLTVLATEFEVKSSDHEQIEEGVASDKMGVQDPIIEDSLVPPHQTKLQPVEIKAENTDTVAAPLGQWRPVPFLAGDGSKQEPVSINLVGTSCSKARFDDCQPGSLPGNNEVFSASETTEQDSQMGNLDNCGKSQVEGEDVNIVVQDGPKDPPHCNMFINNSEFLEKELSLPRENALDARSHQASRRSGSPSERSYSEIENMHNQVRSSPHSKESNSEANIDFESSKEKSSASPLEQKQLKSKSPSKSRKSRSHSPDGQRRSRSDSSQRQFPLPVSFTQKNSPERKRKSRSVSRNRKKKSKSPPKRRSRSKSITKRKKSRSASRSAKRKRSKSRSPLKKKSSPSRSPRRNKRSPSRSPRRNKRSPSRSPRRNKRSPSRSPRRNKRSPSRSPRRNKRSPSRSPRRNKLSKSRSPARRKRSKSTEKSKRSKSRSPTRKRRSRSRSKSATRTRRSRSRRSRSISRRRRGGFRSRSFDRRDRWRREPSHSPILILRKKRSASRTRRSSSKTPPRLTDLDKDQLLEIAKANAAAMCAKAGMPIPESLRPKAILQLPLPTPVPSPLNLPLPLPMGMPMGMQMGMPNMSMNAAMATMTAATMTAALSNMGALANMPSLPALPSITNKPPTTVMPNTANIEEVKRKVVQKANSISIKELTEKCKMIAESTEEMAVAQPHVSDDEEEKPFGGGALRENKGISFSLTNPSAKPALRSEAAFAKEFPVSSGSQHRKKEGEGAYGEWVPVDKRMEQDKAGAAETEGEDTDSVFPDASLQPVDITLAVSERAAAQKRLAENPFDVAAMCMLTRAQGQVDAWAQSNSIPGLFTGSTGAQILSSEELSSSGPQAWIKKDQFLRAAPVCGGVGESLMRKMGWRVGEGLGKRREGTLEPILIDFKTDRKGLVAEGEKTQKSGNLVVMKDLLGKHPVSALMEMCNKKKWSPPEFVMVHHSGPDHRKNFLFKVVINGSEYQPQTASPNKKHAKAMAATVALQAMGEVAADTVHTGPVFTAATFTH